jgi:hypothetical protein
MVAGSMGAEFRTYGRPVAAGALTRDWGEQLAIEHHWNGRAVGVGHCFLDELHDVMEPVG